MKRETLNLFDAIYTKMMKKISHALIAKDVSLVSYCRCMKAAARHPQMVADVIGLNSYYLDAGINLLTSDIEIEMDYSYSEWEKIEMTDDKYVKIVAHSADLVTNDDELCDILGTVDYVKIIEEANLLVLRGFVEYEDVDLEAASDLLNILERFAKS